MALETAEKMAAATFCMEVSALAIGWAPFSPNVITDASWVIHHALQNATMLRLNVKMLLIVPSLRKLA